MRKVILLLLIFCTSVLFGWKLDSWKHTVLADSATYADIVYGEVGAEGACIDAYLDSVYGCTPVVFTTPVKIDSLLTAFIGRTATITVAASNSSINSKAQADYVCDGTADQVQIQAAIDALPSDGGKVVLSEGTFSITAKITITSAISLLGNGKSTILQAAALLGASINPIVEVTPPDSGTEVSNIHFKGIRDSTTIYGWHGTATSHHNWVHHCWFSDFGCDVGGALDPSNSYCNIMQDNFFNNCYIGVFLTGTTTQYGNIVANSQFKDCRTAITTGHVYRTIISGNYIDSATHVGIYIGGSYDSIGYNIIEGNIIKSSGTGLYLGPGSAVGYNRNTVVTGNIITNSQYGLKVHDKCQNILISDNHFTVLDNCYGVILYGTASHIKITNNQFVGDFNGVTIDDDGNQDIVIEGNYFNDCVSGVYFVTTNIPADNTKIRYNIFNNVTTPILNDGTNSKIYEQHIAHFQDCIVEAVAHIHAAIAGTGAEQEITTVITNPDVPRNSSITTTNVGAPSGDVIIEGIDAKGNSISDSLTINPGGITYGDVAFSTVSKIIIPATVPVGDDVEVGISDKLGLNNIIYATGDVYKVKVNNADKTGEFNMAADVDVDYGTLDVSSLVAGAIGAGDDITIWYRSNLNVIE